MTDLIIIGGGPGGYNAAERAAHAGMSVILFEERSLGGVCLNEGCIPTKTLLYSAKILDYAHHCEAYGVTIENASLDHAKVIDRKSKVVKALVSGVGAKMRSAGVKVVNGTARVAGKNANGFSVICENETYEAKKLLICSGSDVALPPIDGLKASLEAGFAVTNREILDMKTLSDHIAVIGGGVIGLEMCSYFNSIGKKVTVIEMMDKIAGPTDGEISALLQKTYAGRGVEFILGAKVVGIYGKHSAGHVEIDIGGTKKKIECGTALVSVGRRARGTGIGLEELGVQMNRSAIVTDDSGRTSVPGIWAAGDVNGRSMLAHTAYREGEVAVNDMLGIKDKVDYRAIPAVIYTNPEVGTVGETLDSAKKQGVNATEHKISLRFSGRYIAENENGNGFVKVIVDEHKRIIGVHMIGSYASEIIYGAAAMVAREDRVTDVTKLVFPHPTVCEIIREEMFSI